MTYLAIDPGKSGGFAWNDGKKFLCAKMPETDEGITQMIAGFAEVRPIVILEKVCGFIGRNQPGSMMFSFGENFGLIKGVALAYGLRLVLVTPQKWQRATIPGTKKDFNYESVLTKGKRKGLTVTKNRWKENLVDHAVRIFPNSNVTTQTADALLILNYALQQNV